MDGCVRALTAQEYAAGYRRSTNTFSRGTGVGSISGIAVLGRYRGDQDRVYVGCSLSEVANARPLQRWNEAGHAVPRWRGASDSGDAGPMIEGGASLGEGEMAPPPDIGEGGEAPAADTGSLQHRAARSAMSLVGRGIAVRVIGLIGNLLIARFLGARQFGMIALGGSVMTVASFISSGGLGSALIQQRGKVERDDLRVVLGFQVAICVVLTMLCAAASIFIGTIGWLATLMVSSLILDSIRVPNGIMLERTMTYRPLVLAEVLEVVTWNVWAVVAVVLGSGVWGVATAQIARACVGLGILLAVGPVGLLLPSFRFRRARAMLSFGLRFQGVALVQLVRDQGFTIVLAAVGGLASLGYWTIIVRLTTVIGVVLESLWRVSFPAMSRILESDDDAGPMLARGMRTASLLTGTLVAPLVGTTPALVPILFGARWEPATVAMPATGAALILTGPVIAVAFGYFMAKGRAGFLLVITIIDTIALFIGEVVLTSLLGLTGASLAMLGYGIVQLSCLSWGLARMAGISVFRETGAQVLATGLAATASWLVVEALGHNVLSLFVGGGTAVLAYVGLVGITRYALLADAVLVVRRALGRNPAPRVAQAGT